MNLPEVYEERQRLPQGYVEDKPFFRESDGDITFAYLFSMLRRRLWVIAGTILLCLAGGLLFAGLSPQIYQTNADVVLLKTANVVPGIDENTEVERIGDDDVQTQLQLITSTVFAEQVYNDLDLANDPDFRSAIIAPPTLAANLRQLLGLGSDNDQLSDLSDEEFRAQAVAFLDKSLAAERVGSSFNLSLQATAQDPQLAALIANAYARIFTTDDVRERNKRNTASAQALGERLDELRQQANADFAAVQNFRVGAGLLSSSATSLSEQEISTYNQQVALARADAARASQELASARSQLSRGGADAVGAGTASGVVAGLRAQRSQLATQEADLARRYLERHPDLVTVREQIAVIDQQIQSEINRQIRSLEANAEAANQRLSSLLASRNSTRSELQGDNIALVRLTDLEREADASKALYQSYLERYNALMAGSGAEQSNARLISLAEAPNLPVSPNWPLTIVLSLVTGLVLGCLLAILTELSYSGLTTLDDVENRLGLRALGSIPDYRTVKPHAATPLDTVSEYPDGPFTEGLRSILVSLGKNANGRCQVIALSSAIPSEGKSTLAACLGRTIAMANQSVVVVDCDIIRSQLSRMFHLNNGEDGLAEALANPDAKINLYQDSDPNMRILPITKPLRKGERLTEGGRLEALVERLRQQFDFVILDTPPILPIAEAREIVALADQVVLIARWRKTLDKIVKSAIHQLPMRTLSKTSVALNMVDMKKQVRFGGSDAASFYKHYQAYYG